MNMNMFKKVALLSLVSVFSFNALAAETTTATDTTTESTNFSFKQLTPALKYAAIAAIFIAYWKYTSPNDKGDKIKIEVLDIKENHWLPQMSKKWLDLVLISVFCVDEMRDAFKAIKGQIGNGWNRLAGWADQQCGFEDQEVTA